MKRAALSSAVLLACLWWAAPSVVADGPVPQAAAAKDDDKDKDKDKGKKAKKAKKPASPAPRKVITDEDLKKYSDDPEGKPRPKTTGADRAAPADDSAAPVEEEHGGRQVWADRAESARDRIAQAEIRISVLEARIAQLRTDRGADGAMEPFRLQRIEADIRKAMEELEAANKELAAARAEQDKLFEEARRRGVPLGWLREP
jgi:hypothetical protein